jgi:hypothetical protein
METRDLKDISLTYFPVQKIPYSKKDTAWRERCVDGVINIAYNYGRSRRSPARIKRRNYNLFNNKIDRADFDYVLNPFNLSKEKLKEFNYPASLQAYDIISPYFNLLLGEESKRLFNPIVRAINEDALSEKQEMKKEEILQALEQMLTADLNPEMQDPNNPPPTPEELKKYQHYTPKMMRESVADKLLQFHFRKENLYKTFNDCFKDALLAGEEIVSVERVGTGVKVRRVNPIELYYVLNNNSDEIDDSEKIYERNYLTVSEIVDNFYEYLTEDQIKQLEEIQAGSIPTTVYGAPVLNIGEVDSIYTFEDDYGQRGIPVHRVRWKSKRKVGIHHFDDGQGEETVDETFKINPEDPTAWVEWFWISEYWEGVRIGVDIYIHDLIRPRKQQFRTMDNMSECKSGYIGNIYSATNSQSVSLMDRLVPWVYLYLVVWYRTELALSKNIGKIALIDTSLIPSGWDPEKWMYYAQALGFGFVNSYNEENRTMGMSGGMNMSMQNKSLDLETSSYIIQHINLLQHIDERIQNTAGITRQRLGSISTSELVGNTERAVTQSSHITEPYFFLHDQFKIRVCEAIIEVAKEALENKTHIVQDITDDMNEILFEIDGNDFVNADYGVFATNSSKDQLVLQEAKQLLQAALQGDKIMLSDAINVLNTTSISDIKASLKKSETEMMQRQQEQQQQQQQMQQQQIQAQQQMQQEQLDREDYNKEQDRQTNIHIAEIKALGFSRETDVNQNQIPDVIEQGKLALDERKAEFERSLQEKKLRIEESKIKQKDLQVEKQAQLKREELQMKEKIEKLKAKNKPKSNKK